MAGTGEAGKPAADPGTFSGIEDMDDEDSQEGKFLTFKLGDEEFGIEIRNVTEIIGLQKISKVPDMPGFIKGVINLRGNVIPVMDVRSRFTMDERNYDDRTCVIVVSISGISVGLVVDTVREVADIDEKNISPAPKVRDDGSSRYIKGMGKVGEDVKILLDVDKLLFEKELEALSQSAA